jgi:hypothetical protein
MVTIQEEVPNGVKEVVDDIFKEEGWKNDYYISGLDDTVKKGLIEVKNATLSAENGFNLGLAWVTSIDLDKR